MFAALVNAVIWCAISAWLLPGIFWYVVGFWLMLIVFLFFKNVEFWAVNDDISHDTQDIDITINGQRYTGTVHKKENQ